MPWRLSSYFSSSSSNFAAANASLRAQLGESQTALRANDAELAAAETAEEEEQ